MDPSEKKEEPRVFGWMDFRRSDSNKTNRCEVVRRSTVIGRDQSLDLRIHDPRISRRQCELIITGSEIEEYKATIKNLTWRKTTLVNGNPLELDETVVLSDTINFRLANHYANWTPNLTIFGSPTLGLKSKSKLDLGDDKQELDKENKYVAAGNKETPIQASPAHDDKKVQPGPSPSPAKESETTKSPHQEVPISPPKEDRSLLESDMRECSIRLERLSVTPHGTTPKVQRDGSSPSISIAPKSNETKKVKQQQDEATAPRAIKVNKDDTPKVRRGKQLANDQEKMEKPKAARRGKPAARNTEIESDAETEIIHKPKPRRGKQANVPKTGTKEADTRRGKAAVKTVELNNETDTDETEDSKPNPPRDRPAVGDIEDAEKPKATRRGKAAAKTAEIERSNDNETEKLKPKTHRGRPAIKPTTNTKEADKPKTTRRGKANTVESNTDTDEMEETTHRGRPAVSDIEDTDKPRTTRQRGKAASKTVEVEPKNDTDEPEDSEPKPRRGRPAVSNTEDSDKPKLTRRGKAAAKAVEVEPDTDTDEMEETKPKSRRGRPAVTDTEDADKPKATRRGKATVKAVEVEPKKSKPIPRRGRPAVTDSEDADKPKATRRGKAAAITVELNTDTDEPKPKSRRGRPAINDTKETDKPKSTHKGSKAAAKMSNHDNNLDDSEKPKSVPEKRSVNKKEETLKPNARRGRPTEKDDETESSEDEVEKKPKGRRGGAVTLESTNTDEDKKPSTRRGRQPTVIETTSLKTTDSKTKKTGKPEVGRGNKKLRQSSPISDVPAKRARREEATIEVKGGRVTRAKKY